MGWLWEILAMRFYQIDRVERNLLVVAAERYAVHVEQEASGFIRTSCDNNFLGDCRIRGGWKWEIRDCFREVILHCIVISKTATFSWKGIDVHCRIYYHHKVSPALWA